MVDKPRYIVKPIVNITAVEYTRSWGVYDNYVIDPDGRHCINEDPNLNLVLECKNKIIADKICELLCLDLDIEEC